jgi:hypothetical protein
MTPTHVPPTVWNVHVLCPEAASTKSHGARLERLLNAHAAKGYGVHSIWSCARKDGPVTRVIFVRHFASDEERDAYLKDQAQRRAARRKPKETSA